MEKKCFRCGQTKPLSDYYKHSQMGDGHLNKCKECTKSDTKERQTYLLNNSPDFVKSERIRGREKYYKLYKGQPIKKECKKKAMGKYKKTYPEKIKAAIASQRIPCPENHNRHHWSYNTDHYRDVIILSSDLHYKIHRYMNYDQSKMMYRTFEGTLLDSREKHELYISKVAEMF